MTAAVRMLAALAAGRPVPGLHLVVTAHPDDETISCAGAMCCLERVVLVQLTDGVHADDPDRLEKVARRTGERDAALAAGDWRPAVVDCATPARSAYLQAPRLAALLGATAELNAVAAVWTHPYEGGHLDHDLAAWACATALGHLPRFEFASYHATAGRDAFGSFWPDPFSGGVVAMLGADHLARKRAAMACYASQAGILRKFSNPHLEHYRLAPTYDFTRPSPPPRSRWDVKGYRPTTAEWRRTVLGAA